MFEILNPPLTLTVSLIVFTSPSTVHLPPFKYDNRRAGVYIVPSAVTFAMSLWLGVIWVPVTIPVIGSPLIDSLQISYCQGWTTTCQRCGFYCIPMDSWIVSTNNLPLIIVLKPNDFISNINNPCVVALAFVMMSNFAVDGFWSFCHIGILQSMIIIAFLQCDTFTKVLIR